MKYIIHYIGEWRPDYLGNGDPIFIPPWKKEYDHLDDIEIFFKKEFEQMLLEDISVSYVDAFMWQIVKYNNTNSSG